MPERGLALRVNPGVPTVLNSSTAGEAGGVGVTHTGGAAEPPPRGEREREREGGGAVGVAATAAGEKARRPPRKPFPPKTARARPHVPSREPSQPEKRTAMGYQGEVRVRLLQQRPGRTSGPAQQVLSYCTSCG